MLLDSSPISVLLIDDDPDDLLLIGELLLELGGVDLTTAGNYEDGIRAALWVEPDVVMTDYRLGARTGLDLLGDLEREGVDVPVVIVTGHADLAVDLDAILRGAASYLDKGELDAATLERTLLNSIERVHAT